MERITSSTISEIVASFKQSRILIVGDIMIDQYWMGSVDRISPEAPIPVVHIKEEKQRLGGAANVANNIAALGATPLMVGIVGDDAEGRLLANIMQQNNISPDHLITDPTRPTTTKTRIIGHTQHIVRVDREKSTPLSTSIQQKLLEAVTKLLPQVDALILEDYNKGLFSEKLIKDIIAVARKLGKIITVDPKFDNFTAYEGVTVFKPNRKEFEDALGTKITDETLPDMCSSLLKKMHLQALLITLGEHGMAYITQDQELIRISTAARKVYDVSGAGDTVIATLSVCLATGCSMHHAVQIATYAAGAVVAEVGVVPATSSMILKSCNNHEA